MTLDGHICNPPDDRRKHWWTCGDCGQLWRRDDRRQWRMTARDPSP